MPNLLSTPIDYRLTRTSLGTWKRYLYQQGALFEEFTSHASIAGCPLLHYVAGRNPETGRIGTAEGFIAIGRKARGFVAIGQAAAGVVALGQLAVGVLLGIGQAACGVVAIGQAAVGVITIGQFAAGGWVGAQFGWGRDLWSAVGTL
jgi:hypothetical protein